MAFPWLSFNFLRVLIFNHNLNLACIVYAVNYFCYYRFIPSLVQWRRPRKSWNRICTLVSTAGQSFNTALPLHSPTTPPPWPNNGLSVSPRMSSDLILLTKYYPPLFPRSTEKFSHCFLVDVMCFQNYFQEGLL